MEEFDSKISFNFPSNKADWDTLCFENGNLLQTTYYDEVQSFFNQVPIYIEVFDDKDLIGGAKLYYFSSNKVPWLFSQTSLFGEPLMASKLNINERKKILNKLSDVITEFNKYKNVVVFNHNSFYGEDTVEINGGERNHWKIAYIDLLQDEGTFLKEMHVKHRNMINKAKKLGLAFEELNNIELFISLLAETYKTQEKHSPNYEFIKHLYEVLSKKGLVSLYFVKDSDNKYLSSALVQKFGSIADYSFGGNIINNFGAGQYLHYNIFLELQGMGKTRYYLGQVANDVDEDNLKFSLGISRFKRRFGVYEKQGLGINLINRPIRYKLWKIMKQIRKKK